jgi:hypothetical protein
MPSSASELACRLAREAEAVCRHYLSNGRRIGNYWLVGDVANTPGHSLFVRLKGRDSGKGAAGKWTDAATGEHGDLLDLIALNRGLATLDAVLDEARAFFALPRPERSEAPSFPASPGSSEAARRLFAISKPIFGTLAEAYLRKRGITMFNEAGALRFHPRCYHRPDADRPREAWPALIAAVTDLSGTLMGVQRTWLDPSGEGKAPIETPRRAMGCLLGNAVRFGSAQDVLAVGEGVETMLSLRCALPKLPMAAALSANHLAAFLFPASLRRLYIALDRDPAGSRVLAHLTSRAQEAGIEAIALTPIFGDFNDDLRRLGLEALRSVLREQVAPEDVARFFPAAE